MVSIPNPVIDYTNMKAGEDYFPDLKADFFAANAFPPCGLTFTAPQLMAQSEENVRIVSSETRRRSRRRRVFMLIGARAFARWPEPPPRRLLEMRGDQQVLRRRRCSLARWISAAKTSSIHAVLGENGAGKSTLIKIISGVVAAGRRRDDLRWSRDPVSVASGSEPAGIVSVFQELSVLPDLSVADNLSITRPPTPLRPHRQARATAAGGGIARPGRLRGRRSARAGRRPAVVAPADRRDRQGARPQSPSS